MTSTDFLISWSLLLITLLLGLAYCVRIRLKGKAIYDRVERQGGSPLLSKSMMTMGYWALQPFSRVAIRAGISANFISFSALFFGAATGVSMAFGHFGVAAILGLLGGVLDALDGMVARATGTMSHAGKVLDSSLDRYVEFFLLAGLLIFYHGSLWLQGLVLATLLGSFMVSYSTALAEITQVQLPRGIMQRPERMVYLILGSILTPLTLHWYHTTAPMLCSLGLIACMGNFSVISRIRYIRRTIDYREQRAISLTLAQVRNIRSSRSQSR